MLIDHRTETPGPQSLCAKCPDHGDTKRKSATGRVCQPEFSTPEIGGDLGGCGGDTSVQLRSRTLFNNQGSAGPSSKEYFGKCSKVSDAYS